MLYKYYHARKQALVTDWKRDRRELLNRVTVVMGEACAARARQEERAREQELQKENCNALYDKVTDLF